MLRGSSAICHFLPLGLSTPIASFGIAFEVPAAATTALPSPRPWPHQCRGAAVRAAAARAITTTQWKWAGVRSLSTSLTQFSSTTVLRAEPFASATLNWMAVYTAKAYRLFQKICFIFNVTNILSQLFSTFVPELQAFWHQGCRKVWKSRYASIVIRWA